MLARASFTWCARPTVRARSRNSPQRSVVIPRALTTSSLVVDSLGATYDAEHWDRSCTFYQGEQDGLLVADNQTLFYTNGDADRRRLLSTLAWGPHADPHLRRTDATESAPR